MKLTTSKNSDHLVNLRLWFGEEYSSSPYLHFYITKGAHGLTLFDVVVGGEENPGVHSSLGLYFTFIHLGLRNIIPWSWKRRSYEWAKRKSETIRSKQGYRYWYAGDIDPLGGRVTGVSIHDGIIWWKFWNNDMAWSNEDNNNWPWLTNGWAWTWNVSDWLLGKHEHEKRTVRTCQNVNFVMPEGCYKGEVVIDRVRWNRRWWNGTWYYRATAKVADGIPIPGKGTCAHNCGDDATFSISFPVEKNEPLDWQVAQNMCMSVLKTRQRHGGLDWTPRGGWPDHCQKAGA